MRLHRRPDELRSARFVRSFTASAPGSVLVQAGRTTILCTASVEPRVPDWMAGQNRGWITTVEVSRVQAEGNLAIAEETRERIGKSMNLVVATYMGGPISVLPLKEEAKTQASTKP